MLSILSRRLAVRALIGLLGTLFVGGVPALVCAQDQEAFIFNGEQVSSLGITLGSWGSGKVEESTRADYTYSGTRSLKFSCQNLYDGGRLDFQKPFDLSEYLNNKAGYIQLIARFGKGIQDEYSSGLTTDPYGASAEGQSRPVRNVLILLQIGNRYIGTMVPLSGCKVGDDGWVRVSAPFAVMKGGVDLNDAGLKRLVVSGDGNEAFYVGAIRLLVDNAPITVYRGDEQNVAVRDDVILRAECEPGAAVVKYSWDFDDSDGIQEDAIGEVTTHQYRKGGEYTVTLTVSDIFGIKSPASTTIKVVVND